MKYEKYLGDADLSRVYKSVNTHHCLLTCLLVLDLYRHYFHQASVIFVDDIEYAGIAVPECVVDVAIIGNAVDVAATEQLE